MKEHNAAVRWQADDGSKYGDTMTIRIAFLLAICISVPSNLFAQGWEQIYPPWEQNSLHDVLHWNGDTLFACGKNWTLLHSVNSGKSWDEMFIDENGYNIHGITKGESELYLQVESAVPKPGNDSLLCYFAYNVSTHAIAKKSLLRVSNSPYGLPPLHIAVSSDYLYVIETAPWEKPTGLYLHRSSDEGNHWEHFPLPGSTVQAFTCATNSVALYASNGTLYRTVNAGRNWTQVPGASFQSSYSPHIASDDRGEIILGAEMLVWTSTDTGATWKQTNSIQWNAIGNRYITGLAVAGPGRYIVLGKESDVYETRNGGITWTQLKEASAAQTGSGSDAVGITICPGGGMVVVNEEGHISYSEDEGLTWETTRTAELVKIRQIHFYDTHRGLVVSATREGADAVFMTADGGRTWERTGSEITKISEFVSFDDINGYTIEKWDGVWMFTLWNSTDQGRSWQYVHESSIGNQYGFLFSWKNVYIIRRSTDYHVSFLYSYDAGRTWLESSNPDSSFYCTNILFKETHSGTLIAYFVNNRKPYFRPTLWASYDSCKTWTQLFTPWYQSILGFSQVEAVGSDTIIVKAEDNSDPRDSNILFMTTNRGNTWNKIGKGLPSPEHLIYRPPAMYMYWNGPRVVRSLDLWETMETQIDKRAASSITRYFFHDDSTAWLTGGGYIYHTGSGGVNSTPRLPEMATSARIISVYPNPVSQGGTAAIEISISRSRHGMVLVSLYDVHGCEQIRIFDGEMEIGTQSLSWHIPQSLSAGRYFLRMMTDLRSSVTPVVVVK